MGYSKHVLKLSKKLNLPPETIQSVTRGERQHSLRCSVCGLIKSTVHFREWLCREQHTGAPIRCNKCFAAPEFTGYKQRNADLHSLGFRSYRHYLNSEMWATIRGMVLARDKNQCQWHGCGNRGTQVHHISYGIDVLIGKSLGELISLCDFHHGQAEFSADGDKRDLPEVRLKTQQHFKKKFVSRVAWAEKHPPRWSRNHAKKEARRYRLMLKEATGPK